MPFSKPENLSAPGELAYSLIMEVLTENEALAPPGEKVFSKPDGHWPEGVILFVHYEERGKHERFFGTGTWETPESVLMQKKLESNGFWCIELGHKTAICVD